jgi:hypothetical protein
LRFSCVVASAVLAATEAVRENEELTPDEDDAAVRQMAVDRLGGGQHDASDVWKSGRELSLADALEVARRDAAEVHASTEKGFGSATRSGDPQTILPETP